MTDADIRFEKKIKILTIKINYNIKLFDEVMMVNCSHILSIAMLTVM